MKKLQKQSTTVYGQKSSYRTYIIRFFYQNKKCVGIKPKDTFILLLEKRRSIYCLLGRIIYKIIKASIIYNKVVTTVFYLRKLWKIVALHMIKFCHGVILLR